VGQNNLRAIIDEIEKKLAEIQIDLVDVEYRKESEDQMLRIYIDTDSGVNLDTCAAASRAIKNIVDEEDLYYDHMEVSSPGLDRIIKKEKDFIRFMGQEVDVKTHKGYDGPRKISGVLTGYQKETLSIKDLDMIMDIPFEFISVVRLKPDK